MKVKKILYTISIVFVLLTLTSCRWFSEKPKRETILDKIVSIPKQLVYNIPYLPPLCDTIPGLKKGYAPIRDGKLYYEEEGQGIPLVLISGGPGYTHHIFHPYFSRIKDIARVIYYDQRGIGKSSRDETGKTYIIDQAVEDLESLRKYLNIKKWALLGWSYGGLLAQLYALKYPDRCIGIILGVSEITIYKKFADPKREKAIFSKEEMAAFKNIEQKEKEGQLNPDQAAYNKMLAGDWKRYNYYKPTQENFIRKILYAWDASQEFVQQMQQNVWKTKLEGKFENFKIPTLILEAQWELLWWDNAEERANLFRKNHPHAHIEIFEKSGHIIFEDEPEKFFSILKDFLIKISRTA
jgi:proline iminopeptidase